MWNQKQHTYEEIREVVVDLLLRRDVGIHAPVQWISLVNSVGEVLAQREANSNTDLHPHDQELVRDVFWDLFRQGFITLGMNNSNPEWPFFRISHVGSRMLASQSPYRFHDTSTYLALVRKEVPDLSDEAAEYLDESVASFYAGCLLASSVMLGVAAEAEFLRLLDVATMNGVFGAKFEPAAKERFIRAKIVAFQKAITPLMNSLPREATEDLDTNLAGIQSLLRTARNDAGHPSVVRLEREQVYIHLQLFVPFARQLMRLRGAMR